MSHEVMPLDLLRSGDCAEVIAVHGEPAWVGRMAELGLRVGGRLRVVQGGNPCLLQIGESRLSLRGDLSFQIMVQPIESKLP